MSVKRILTALRLDKIAGVDRPCQEGATVALIKRATDYEDIIKAKYDTKQREEMAGKEAMPDGSYPIADATDLENAIHAVGRGRNNSHAAIRSHIKTRAKALGLEDKLPDSWSDGAKLAKSLYDVFEKAALPLDPDCDPDESAQAFDDVLGEQQLRDDFWNAWYKGTAALQESVLSILKDDEAADKSALISDSLKQFADYVEQTLPGDIGKSLAAGIAASVGQPGTTTGEVMTPELKKALGLPETATDAEVMKAIADKNEAVTKAEGDLVKANEEIEKAKAKAPVNDDDADDMAKALANGEAFKTPEGTIITKKAVGDGIYTVLKSQNEQIAKQAVELAKAREREEEGAFAKRADELGFGSEFGPTLRKAYGGDAAAQTELEKRVAGLQKQVEDGDLFKNFGHNAPAADSAEAEFMAKVDEVKKAHPNLTDAQAYTKAYEARDNREIVKRMKAETASA